MVSDGSIELEVEQSDSVSLKNYKKTETVRDFSFGEFSGRRGNIEACGLKAHLFERSDMSQNLLFISFNQQILERLSNLCVSSYGTPSVKNRKHEQRLLRNMGAHTVVLELLQIPYEKVNCKLESSDQLSI